MEKQILIAVEEAYRKGLRDGNLTNDITPFLLTSQIVAHDVANKFYKPSVIGSCCEVCGKPSSEKTLCKEHEHDFQNSNYR